MTRFLLSANALAVCALIWACTFSQACKGVVPSNVVQAGVATVETAICILNVAQHDAALSPPAPPGQVVADAIQQCGTDAATIALVLDAHRALELAEQRADGGR